MSETVMDLAAEARREVELDPFAFQIGCASKVAGLAAGYQSTDANYVFHTEYVEVGRGIAEFSARFAGLKSKEGSLLLRVHMMGAGEPPKMALVNSERIAFSRLIIDHGLVRVRFEAFKNARYAFYGAVVGKTDAEADGLTITLQLPQPEAHLGDADTEARNSEVGAATDALPHILSPDRPRLAVPVSQVATAEQLTEPAAKQGGARIAGFAQMNPLEKWAALYTVQALTTYGALSPEARGLGLGDSGAALATTIADHVASVSVVGGAAPETTDGRGPQENISYSAASATLGSELANYDFLWASDVAGFESANDWVRGVETAISSLLPNGFAVLTFSYDPKVPMRRPDHDTHPVRIGRAEFERLVLILISRGHQVAQLKLVGNYKPLTVDTAGHHSAVGLVVRRAALAT